ncbi:TetR/AcrR family transcriptional regulator [Streptomyces caatingaensis]|uniref:HTH tetR-type domain-containing protein n=1 Tax=Streptomyces caatingaensis TaxID=1678637 RepID=A0A0K9XBQ3_9ACTN|nr:TetR/AcrR family transcriptional regulator [Streptomyces caatingaensis]KNB50536.1 hypothetical protein AC230_21525 [Streptomyces caatingaensis]
MTGSRPARTGKAPVRRAYDSARSRELLLTAARDLFTEKGFDRTTTRDIGERAGVDPALIARYFGSKTQLYLATLTARSAEGTPPDLLAGDRLHTLLSRADRGELGPVLRTAVMPHDDPAVQDAARTHLYTRLVAPLSDRFARDGVPQPRLRAELAVAALAGIVLGHTASTLTELAAATPDELLAAVRDLLTPQPAPDSGDTPDR